MKKFLIALALIAAPAFSQDVETLAPEAPVATEEKASETLPEEAPALTGCEPEAFQFTRLCGQRFDVTICSYGAEIEIKAGGSCEGHNRLRQPVCKKLGKFDDSLAECRSASRLRPRF